MADDTPMKLSKRLIYLEDVLLLGLIGSVLWVFSTDLHSHFTLPKLALLAVFISALAVPWLLRLYYADINLVPLMILLPLLLLVSMWLLSTHQAAYLFTALMGQPGRYNGLLTHLLYVMLFLVVANLRFDEARRQRFIYMFYIGVIPVCIYALWQYYVGSEVFDLSENGYRPISSIGNPVSLAAILAMAVAMVFYEVLSGKDRLQMSLFVLFLLVLLLCLFLTTSRGGWLGAAAGVLVVILYSKLRVVHLNNAYFWLSGVILACGLVIFYHLDTSEFFERLTSMESPGTRLVFYGIAAQAILDHPWLGSGFESFRLIYPAYRVAGEKTSLLDITPTMVHNDYLQMGVDTGLLAMCLYLVFLVMVVRMVILAIRRYPERSKILVPVLAALAAFMTQSLFGWLEVSTSAMFWLFLGVAVSIASDSGTDAPQADMRLTRLAMLPGIGLFALSLFITARYIETVTLDHGWRSLLVQQARGSPLEAVRIAAFVDENSRDNFFYQDKLGQVFMNRMIRSRRKTDYEKALGFYRRAAELHPLNAYIGIHVLQLDVAAITLKVVRQPDHFSREMARKVADLDPNNPSVHETLARYYRVIGDHQAAASSTQQMIEAAGGMDNIRWREEAREKRRRSERLRREKALLEQRRL